jgi:AraC-like DNA-binding protein
VIDGAPSAWFCTRLAPNVEVAGRKEDSEVATIAVPLRTTDPLGESLHLVRMRGAFYSRTTAGAPWSLEMPPVDDSLSFHVVTAGQCWLVVPGSEPVALRAGDLAVVPHGRGHVLASEPGRAPTGRVDLVPQHYLTENYSVLEYGGDGEQASMVCGVVAFDDPAARALMGVLPSVIHVDPMSPGSSAVHETIRLLSAELGDLRPGGEAVTTRLTDVLVIHAIRHWLDHDAEPTGWLGALRDERIGAAMVAVHRHPGEDWTVERLAREAAMSRSSFAARFTQLVGEPAMSYMTRWRMQVARTRLESGTPTVSELAAALGYRSEAAFTRAFTRINGVTPGAVRRARTAAT